MSPEEFQKLPIIPLGETAGTEPTSYTEIQKVFLPYVDTYHTFLWFCFFATIAYLVTRFILLPLIKGEKSQS
jgi:hypothetical protein